MGEKCFMKKTICIFSFIVFSIFSVFANELFISENLGTYIPYSMYENVEKTKSYYEGISASSAVDVYTVLCITEDGILSNIRFHDAYKLTDDDINFDIETIENKKFLIDKKTRIKYIKISDSTDYYFAYDKFLEEIIISEIAKNNSKLSLEDSKIIFDGEEYKIDKDQWHYSENMQIILYSLRTKKYIGFSNNIAYFLKDGDELSKVLDKLVISSDEIKQ
jgi:hypothetical protein